MFQGKYRIIKSQKGGGSEMNEMTKENLFFCYDFSLKNKLKSQGIKYIVTAISNSERRFWLFWRTKQVNQIIAEHVKQQ